MSSMDLCTPASLPAAAVRLISSFAPLSTLSNTARGSMRRPTSRRSLTSWQRESLRSTRSGSRGGVAHEFANLPHLHVGVTESRNRETTSEPTCGSLPTMAARARPR